jgi:hypothetical protein
MREDNGAGHERIVHFRPFAILAEAREIDRLLGGIRRDIDFGKANEKGVRGLGVGAQGGEDEREEEQSGDDEGFHFLLPNTPKTATAQSAMLRRVRETHRSARGAHPEACNKLSGQLRSIVAAACENACATTRIVRTGRAAYVPLLAVRCVSRTLLKIHALDIFRLL